MPEEILRLLLGGVDWGFGLMFAGQGDKKKDVIWSKKGEENFKGK